MEVALRDTEQKLQQLLDREQRADHAKRLRTVLLAKQGYSAPEIATCTGFCRRMVQFWVARYNVQGLSGLDTKPGRGRKGPLNAEEVERLTARIDAGPLPKDGVCALRGRDIQRILEAEFDKLRSLNAVYGLLHRLGYSSLVPRPRHAKSDPAAQAEFKKSFASDSTRSKTNTLTVDYKSSTKTRRDSVSKEH